MNRNTREAFKQCDKAELLRRRGLDVWRCIADGSALARPALLSAWLLLTFAVCPGPWPMVAVSRRGARGAAQLRVGMGVLVWSVWLYVPVVMAALNGGSFFSFEIHVKLIRIEYSTSVVLTPFALLPVLIKTNHLLSKNLFK